MQNAKAHVKGGDKVIVIAGKEKSKSGKILNVDRVNKSVTVEGLNVVKRHVRARANQAGSLIEKEAPIAISNVMLFCDKCNMPVRSKISLLDDGSKVRVCKKCGTSFDK